MHNKPKVYGRPLKAAMLVPVAVVVAVGCVLFSNFLRRTANVGCHVSVVYKEDILINASNCSTLQGV